MHDASAITDLTGIDLSRFVVMQHPRPAKRTGELLKLAARLIGTLPAPRTVTVYATAQEISLGFDGTAAGVTALVAWASDYHAQLTGEMTDLDGEPAVRCGLTFTRDGITVDAYAYVRTPVKAA